MTPWLPDVVRQLETLEHRLANAEAASGLLMDLLKDLKQEVDDLKARVEEWPKN